jgi:hypothetical protein
MAQTRVGIRRPSIFNGLLAYYRADGTANDQLGNYNGTLVNGATYGVGKIGQGFSFDGVNDTVNLGNVLNNDGTQAMSWSMWVNFASSPSFDALIAKYNAGTGYYITMTNTNRVQFGIGQTLTSNAIRVFSSNVLSINTWYHVVATYDGSKLANGIKIYINNSNTTLTTNYDTFTGSSINSQIVQFGRAGLGGTHFNGIMDEIAIYNKELTPSEITQLYNEGNGKQK